MKKYLLAAILLAPLMTPIAFAECSKEAAPAIPDGASATEQEMIAGQQAVKSYIASSNAYLECLDAEGVAAGARLFYTHHARDERGSVALCGGRNTKKKKQATASTCVESYRHTTLE